MARAPLGRADRVSTILDRLALEHSLTAASLAAEFGVSTATLRRDLRMLEEQRLLVRTHGGALAAEVSYELPLRYRGGRNRDLKLRVAAAAAALLPKGLLTVGLTGGTTTSAVARAIASRVDLTVVTNALNIATELALRPRLKVITTGGVARSQSYELVGPFADQTLAGLRLEVAVVGVDDISVEAGLTTHDEAEALTNRTMITRAQHVMVVADGSKIGRMRLAWICGLDAVSSLVTDATADPLSLEAIRQCGLTVHVVD